MEETWVMPHIFFFHGLITWTHFVLYILREKIILNRFSSLENIENEIISTEFEHKVGQSIL